ncbi:signal peptide peptidase SppA [Chryseolinea sp. H1M3-3]|uniref:signal peptide peptidase SppA n=1 Tax=Chryseolinea sp. H1M3-3 TaxID=3034144 RepID=UPI0023EBF246|nr:signal peptide peptidase SppA [Chryseolinea sp. H1M3-3]
MNFWKAFFASCLGALVAMILLCVIIVVIISASGGDEVKVQESSILQLDLDAPVNEIEKELPLMVSLMGGTSAPHPIGLAQLRQTIAHAKDDDNIKGIYLTVTLPQTGYTVLEEIRQALIDFRTSGKWVVVYSEMFSESAYYLASAADKIYLNPEGELEFNGLSAEVAFFKRLFDKLEVKPEVFRVGEFKSAVEPFLLEKMSAENRLQLNEMINSIYNHILDRVSEARKIPRDKLKEIADKMLVRNARQAMEHGLVDSLLYVDQVEQELKKRVGIDSDKKLEFIKYSKYKRSFSAYKSSKNEVAVVVAEGTIIPGKSEKGDNIIGAESFTKEMKRVRDDDEVKAVVVRINSPGGSFQASDAMWREIKLTAQKKPVIASMSDYAASGGYFLAMACDTIVAQPHTITGSIGVFSVLFDASGFLNNKIGITTEEIKTGDVGELITVTRPLTPLEKEIWQIRTNEVYETFTGKAAEGRDIPIDSIKKVASGRVWTGSQAMQRKLVDVVGNFDDALNIAAKSAGLTDDYKVRYYPQYTPSLVEQIITQVEEEKGSTLKETLGEHYHLYEYWNQVKTYQGTQARMPYELTIH